MPVTIKDVARQVGVSTSTVSRVLTGHPGIGAETKARVLEAVAALRYQPNAVARSLVNSRTRTLCFVFADRGRLNIAPLFILEILTGLSDAATERGYHVMYRCSDSAETERDQVLQTASGRVADGLVIFNDRGRDRLIESLRSAGFPFVLLGHPEDYTDELYITADDKQAMYRETSRMIELGHKRIAYIGGPRYRGITRDRFEGFYTAMHEHDLPLDERMVLPTSEYSEEAGRRFVEERLSSGSLTRVPFTGILTNDDRQAVGAINALRRAGIEGVSVQGFQNLPYSAWNDPPVNSVDLNPRRIGNYAARLLIDQLEGQKTNVRHYIVRSSTIDRGSVGPVPGSAVQTVQSAAVAHGAPIHPTPQPVAFPHPPQGEPPVPTPVVAVAARVAAEVAG